MKRASLLALVTLAIASLATATTPQAPLHLGRIWVNPEFDGAEGWHGSCVQYPAGIPEEFKQYEPDRYCRQWVGHGKKRGTYLFSTNWTDPLGNPWQHVVSYAFRSFDYDYPTTYSMPRWNGGDIQPMAYVYPVSIQEKLRWERPVVTLRTVGPWTGADSLATIDIDPGSAGWETVAEDMPFVTGDGPRPDPIIDPTLVTEETIETSWRYMQGVELFRTTYAYPIGTPHQDYTLEDITLTNNGISGNVAGAPVLTDQTLTGVMWASAFDYCNVMAPIHSAGNDANGMYVEPWGSGSHAAVLFWDEDSDETEILDWGDPAEDDWYMSHLLGNAYVLMGPMFVSSDPGAGYATDDAAQPLVRMMYYERGIDDAGQVYSPLKPEASPVGAVSQRKMLAKGEFSLPLNTSYKDFPPTAAINDGWAGPVSIMGYGKAAGAGLSDTTRWPEHGWTLPFGESVRIVQIMAAGGVDQEEARRISVIWKAAAAASSIPTSVAMRTAPRWEPPDPGQTAEEIAYIQTGRDTAMKAAAMAYWNLNGALPPNVDADTLAAWGISDLINPKPAGHGAYDVPDGPRPPARMHVGPVEGAIEVRWSTEAESSLDHDTGILDFAGYRVLRQEGSRTAPWTIVAEGDTSLFTAKAASGEWPAGRSFVDATVESGTPYWYAVSAYDDGTQNWARPGKPLASAKWWTWTGYSGTGTYAGDAGAKASMARVSRIEANMPNPFNPVTTIKFTLEQPTPVKIMVYNTAGQHVRTLVDGARQGGVHTVVWDGRDATGRECASGVYLSRLVTPTATHMQRMLLVR